MPIVESLPGAGQAQRQMESAQEDRLTDPHCGWLRKLGADAASHRLARVKRRWFELHCGDRTQGSDQQHELRYYVKQVTQSTSTPKRKGTILIGPGCHGAGCASRVVVGDSKQSKVTWGKQDFPFRLIGSERTWVLSAATAAERADWIHKLVLSGCTEEECDDNGINNNDNDNDNDDNNGHSHDIGGNTQGELVGPTCAANGGGSRAGTSRHPCYDIQYSLSAAQLRGLELQLETADRIQRHGVPGASSFQAAQIKRDTQLDAGEVTVTGGVEDESAARQSRLRKGDVITAVDGKRVQGRQFKDVLDDLRALKARAIALPISEGASTSTRGGTLTVRRPKHFFPRERQLSLERALTHEVRQGTDMDTNVGKDTAASVLQAVAQSTRPHLAASNGHSSINGRANALGPRAGTGVTRRGPDHDNFMFMGHMCPCFSWCFGGGAASDDLSASDLREPLLPAQVRTGTHQVQTSALRGPASLT